MKKLIILLAVIVLSACEKQTIQSFTITNQISNYCYHPQVHFNDGSVYNVVNGISSLGMTTEKIKANSTRFKFMFTNRENQTYINTDWVDVNDDNIIIGSHMTFRRYE